MRETKFDASFQVVEKQLNKTLTGKFIGVVHLFEHFYDEDTHFWHCVAEAVLPPNALSQNPPDLHWVERVNIFLEDGRAGQAVLLTANAQGGASGDYAKMQLGGVSTLKELDPDSPHFGPLVD